MAFRFGYFDSEITGIDDEGMPIFDRAETSDLFALLFANLVSDGVLALPSNCFRVRAAGNGLNLELDPGFGMVKGHFCYNDEVDHLTIESAPQQYNRIDRVVMRCNYLERMVEILIKTGIEAANPVPPELIRPAAGDYFELCLANIRLTAGQKVITQSSITDTRPDSSVCGFITQLIDHLDTEVFYDQFNAFYTEFVEKSDASYEMFQNMATQAYNGYTAAIDEYIEQLEAKGNADLTATTEALKEFQRNSQNAFNAWFAEVQGLLDEDVAGRLINITNEQGERLSLLEYMNIHNDFFAPLLDDDGNVILDDDDNAVMVDWKYMYA